MAITHKFTRTLPTPLSTHNGFVFLLTTAWFTQADQGAAGSPIDGGATSIANGGGDMQAFSDEACTQRIPLHVVDFVTGLSPDAQVWARLSTWADGDTITIGMDSVQTVQPPVTDTYGQYAVRSDYALYSADGTTDDTGNHSLSPTGTPLVVGGKLSTASSVTTSDYYSAAASTKLQDITGTDFTVSAWVKYETPSFNNKASVLGQNQSTSGKWWDFGFDFDDSFLTTDDGVLRRQTSNGFDMDTDGTFGTWYLITASVDTNSLFELTTDDVLQSITSPATAGGCESTKTFYIGGDGAITGGSQEIQICELTVRERKSQQFIADEYSNQDDPDNFGTSSEWVGVGGVTFIPAWAINSNNLIGL